MASLPAILAFAITSLLTATCTRRNADPVNVSVRDVVIDPYSVDGKLIRLSGFFRRAPDGDALYWHKADIAQSIPSHAVKVSYSSPAAAESESDGTYVAMEGIYYATKPPRRGWSSERGASADRYNGDLVDARRVYVR